MPKQIKRKKERRSEPYLGIFWLVKNSLIIEAVPLSQGEEYDLNVSFPGSHIDVWQRLQTQGRVPRETAYEEFARGRIVHQTRTGEFFLLADRCILENGAVVARIRKALHLPQRVKLATDDHYRCHHCLYGTTDEEDDHDDL